MAAKQPLTLQEHQNHFEKLSLDEQLQLLQAFKTVIKDKEKLYETDLQKIKGAKLEEGK